VRKKESGRVVEAARAELREGRRGSESAVSLSALREQAAGLRRAQVMAKLAHVVTSPDGSFETWSETLPELLGLEPGEVFTSTRRWLDCVHPEDRTRFRSVALEARAKGTRAQIEYRVWRKDGTWVYVRQVMEPIPGTPDGQGRMRWFNTLQDITELVHAQQGFDRLNRVYAVLSGINSAIIRVRERQHLFEEACRVAVEAGGFVMAWIGLVDSKASLVVPAASAGDVRGFFETAPMAILQTKRGGHGLAGEAVRSRRSVVSNDVRNDPKRLMRAELGERGINSLAIIPLIIGAEVVGVLALYASEAGFFDAEEMRLLEELASDVSFALEHIDKAQKLEYLSYYDSLTGLPNRAFFYERLKLQLQDAARSGECIELKILDIERFKTINDSLGRQAGDLLLSEVAKRMERVRPASGWCARIGADHFAVVTPGVPNDEDIARRTQGKLREIFGQPLTLGNTELRVSARVGIALFPRDGTDGETLLRNAEAALKRAKASNEAFLLYKQQMTEWTAENLSLENQLRQALEKDQFVLHYQPKVDAQTGHTVGLEALMRWQSPELGLVSPVRFIPLLEQTGLIREVGSWALRQASLQHQAWARAGLRPPRIAVNVSAIQLRGRDFAETVERAITQGAGAQAIDLEITESVVMEDIQATIAKLAALRRLGVGVAIDDFGTGYSSLAYLARLPVETLKIDRSFVKAMASDDTARTLVETIISLAHSLRLKVVAEGVETEEQAAILGRLQCDQMQGYLFSKPLPADEVAALLQGR
jgi:diguanylate cyclase (GGDEF)-like protein/PAS domain S-box-containing protein